MQELIAAAADLQCKIDALGIPNCVIGGIALQAWGEPRLTRDIDFTLLTRFIDEESKLRSVLNLISPRRPDAFEFATINRVLLGTHAGISIDIGLGGFEYEEGIIRRSVLVELLQDVQVRLCGPEDLIIMKTFAGRGQDWVDIEGIVARTKSMDFSATRRVLQMRRSASRLFNVSGLRWIRLTESSKRPSPPMKEKRRGT